MNYDRFTSSDLTSLVTLAGELRDLPDNLLVRAEHMLRGLCALVHAQVGIFCAIRNYVPDTRWSITPLLDFGWAGAEERRWNMSFFDGLQLDDPFTSAAVRVEGKIITLCRTQAVDDRQWYGSANVNELRRRARIDHCIYSTCRLDAAGNGFSFALHRPWGDRPFSERDVALIDAFQRSQPVYRLQPARLDAGVAALSPRQQQVLQRLLKGDSEKQVASHLGLSQHTVHVHVKALYRRFNVASRGELLSMWLRRPGVKPPFLVERQTNPIGSLHRGRSDPNP